MTLDINEEINKLIQIVNDNKFDWLKIVETSYLSRALPRINFLWQVLTLTIKYSQVELYLKNLLNHFAIDELENIFNGLSILHHMCRCPSNISLNAFEIVINYGIDVNIKSEYNNNVATHKLFYNQCNNHINNILSLLIKYGINLNATNLGGETTLDVLLHQQKQLNEENIICMTTIIDFGGTSNLTRKNNEIFDFAEYYKCSSIKPAIKNENKI